MVSAGAAPATTPSRAIVGPFFTASGFKYWYLACLPDCIVAVPQGLWTSIMLAMSNNVAPIFGLLGGLASGRGHSLHARIAATLPSTPDSQLRMKPNTVFQIAQLRAINFKGGKFSRHHFGDEERWQAEVRRARPGFPKVLYPAATDVSKPLQIHLTPHPGT
jgi:hypothetical protein